MNWPIIIPEAYADSISHSQLKSWPAKGLWDKSVFQIHEYVFLTSKDQTLRLLSLCSFNQATHKEVVDAKRSHTSWRFSALFQTTNFLNPKTPSVFGRQQDYQETLASQRFWISPDHKNQLHKDSISFKHPLGRQKAVNQKFTRL